MADFIDESLRPIDPNTGLTIEKEPIIPVHKPTYSPKSYENLVSIPDIKFSAVEGMPYGENPKQYAGEHQSNWEQLGGFLNQSIVGEITGGTIEGIGNILDFQQSANLVKGTEDEFSNWLSEAGKGLRTWSEEATPIYTDYEEGSFSPGHLSWWLKNGTSVASTLSLMIPAMGTVKAVGMLGKALKIAPNLTGKARWMTIGIEQAVVSRHLENMMEASQTWKESYDTAITSGLSQEEAQKAAAVGANAVYNANWAMLAQDIPQYLLLGKAFGKSSAANTIGTARALGLDTTPILAKAGTAHALNMISEGGEEAYQYVVQKEGESLARKSWDKNDKSSFDERLNTYLNSGQLWTNAVFGAVGAGVFQTAGKLVNNAINKSKGIQSEEQRRVADIESWVPQINYWHDRLREAQEYGDVHAEVRAENELWSVLAAKAAYNGNIDNIKDFLAKASSTTEEQAEQLGFDKDAVKSFREAYPKAIKKFDEAAKIYDSLNKENKYSPEQIAELTRAQLSLRDLDELSKKTAHEYAIAESNIVNLDQVSPAGQQIMLKRLQLNSLQNTVAQMNKWLETRTLDEEQKKSVQARLELLNGRIKDIQKEIPVLMSTKTKEQVENDKNVRVDTTSFEQAYKLAGKKLAIEEAINSNLEYIDKIKGKKQEQQPTAEVTSTPEEQDKPQQTSVLPDTLPPPPVNLVHDEEGKLKPYGTVTVSPLTREADSPYLRADISTPETKGHVSIKDMGDGTAVITDIQIGYNEGQGRGKGFGTEAYKKIGEALAEQGLTLESTSWNKHNTAISPAALRIWEKLTDEGFAVQTGKETGKLYNRETGEEQVTELPLYQFTSKESPFISRSESEAKGITVNYSNEEELRKAWSTSRTNTESTNKTGSDLLKNESDKVEAEFGGKQGYIYKKDGKIRFRSSTTDVVVADANSKVDLKTLGVNVLNTTALDMEVSADGNSLTVNGKRLELAIPERPLTAINHDENGNPISITLRDTDGKLHTYTNKILVTETSYLLALQEAIRSKALQFIVEDNATFVYVQDANSEGVENKVYFSNGIYKVVKDQNSNSTNADVIDSFFTELSNIIQGLSDYKKANPKATNEDLKNESRRLVSIIRSPNAREINTEKSAGEISLLDRQRGQTEEVSEKATDQETAESEKGILSNIRPEKQESVQDVNTLSVVTNEALSTDETVDSSKDSALEVEDHLKALNPQFNVAYVFYNKESKKYTATNQEFEDFVSNPNNSLDKAVFEYYINKDYTPFWSKQGRNLNELLGKGNLSLEQVNSILGTKTPNYDNVVDNIPISIRIKVGDKVFDGNLFYHTTSFGKSESDKLELRSYRTRILTELLQGNIVESIGAEKYSGTINNSGGNKKLNTVRGIDPNKAVLGIADLNGNITAGDGSLLLGMGSPGSVYLETTATANGSKRLVKLNVSKVSKQHAEILWEALNIAAKSGLNTLYTREGVDKVKVKTIINSLVYNGKDTMEYRDKTKYPNLHLATKTLYLEDKVLHYSVDSSINLSNPSEQDKADFINWAIANKNYIVYRKRLGVTNNRNYNIGNFSFKAGELYNKSLIDNGIITTDLDSTKPFTRPVIKLNLSTLASRSTTSVRVTEKQQSDIVRDEQGNILYSNKPILVNRKSNKLWLLPVGTRINLPGEEYMEITGTANEKKLKIVSSDPEISSFNNISISSDNTVKIDSLLSILDFFRLYAKVQAIPEWYNKVEVADVETPRVEEKEELIDTFTPQPVNDKPLPESIWDDDLFGSPVARIATTTEYRKANIDKELKWFRKRLGSVPVNLSSRLLYIGSKGKNAHGVFTRDSITLYTGAEEGTLFHEAFHRVSLMYLTEAERNGIYNEARSKFGLKKATNEQVEERLAEEFRTFVLNEVEQQKQRNLPQKVAKFFKELFDFIYTFFVNKSVYSLDMDKLFRNIQRGTYRNTKYLKENYSRLGSSAYLLEAKGVTINSLNNMYELNLMVKSLMFLVFKNSNILSVNDLSKLDIESIRPAIEATIQKYAAMKEKYPAYAEKIDSLISMWNEVNEKFPTYKQLINEHLAALKIKEAEDVEDTEEDKVDNGNEEHDKSAYEYDSKHNAASAIKLMVTTLPSEEGVDPILDLPIFTDFAVAWSTLMRDLSGTESYSEMKNKVDERAKNSKLYSGLADRLNKADENLKTQFFVTFSKHKHKFLNVTYEIKGGKPVFQLINADLAKARKAYVSEWGVNFINSSLFEDATTPNKEVVRDTINKFKTLTTTLKSQLDKLGRFEDIIKAKNDTVDLLRTLGLPFDVEQLNYILDSYNESQDTALYKFLSLPSPSQPALTGIFGDKRGLLDNILTGTLRKSKEGATLPYHRYLSDERVIKRIAEVYGTLFPSRIEDSVLGAGGKQFYVYSLNNYITDFARQISNNTADSNGMTMLDKLQSIHYNKNSVWLKELLTDSTIRNRFSINTFSGLIKLRSGDTGKDYAMMTEEEKYLLNLTFINNGQYPLPTVADKKSYFIISGPSIIKSEFTVNDKGQLIMPEEVTKLFYGYFLDEYNRILRTKEELRIATESGDESGLIRYYHKNKSKSDGNGLKFQLFSEAKVNTDNSVTFNLGGTEIQIDPTSFSSSKKAIMKVLTNRLTDELERAEKYRLIELSKGEGFRMPTRNLLLDPEQVAKYTKDLGNESKAVTQVLFKYLVNQMVATVETYKLLSGDPAFYKGKGSVDALFTEVGKRLPELTSTGDRLRLDYPASHEFANKSTFTVSSINDNVLISKFYDALYNYHESLYNKFFSKLVDTEGNKLYNQTQVEAMAKAKAETKLKNYKEVNQTDAQVYISPSFYRELRIRLGEWSNKHQEAYDLLMSDADITASQETEILDLVMQPLKMLHYGMTLQDGLGVPVYDKMSLATLFPRTIKAINENADLMQLFNRMEKEGDKIDMIKFESAVKVGNTSGMSFYEEGFSVDNLPVSHQELRNLRRQLNTDPHDTVRRNAGTQFRKISLSNIRKDNNYTLPTGDVTGSELLEIWRETSSELSNKGKDKLLNKLGYNTNGQVNNAPFIDILRKAAEQANMHDDIINALTLDANNQPFMQIDSLMDRDWIYSRILASISKNVVDINLPGNAFIQLTNFGLQSAEKSELLFQDDKGRIQTIVSINLFKHIIPEYNSKTFEEKRKWLLSQGELPILGYRIPTQSAASIVPLTVVDVLPESVGDTIILPAEFTTLTGSDFDIDKLFAVRYNYKVKNNKAKKIEFLDANTSTLEGLHKFYDARYKTTIDLVDKLNTYISREVENLNQLENDPKVQELLGILRVEIPKDITDEEMDEILKEKGFSYEAFKRLKEKVASYPSFDKFVEDNKGKSAYQLNAVEALENRLIDIYFAVLTNPEHKAETTTPLDAATALVDEAVEFIKDNTSIKKLASLGATTPLYQTDVWNRNMAGKAGIAPFALNNTHHILSQISGLKLNIDLGFGNRITEGEDKVSDLSAIYGTDNELISDWLAAFINIHVDNAKDPKAYYLNVNKFTWSMASLLVRVGSGSEARYFLPQPVLVELAKADSLAPKAGTAKVVTGSRLFKKQITDKYKKLAGNSTIETDPAVIMSQDFLKKQLEIKEKDRNSQWYANQLSVLNLFYKLKPIADSLNEFVQLSQIDTKNYGNNLVHLRQFKRKVEEFFKTSSMYFLNATDMYDMTFLRSNYNNMILKTLDLFGDKTITSTPVFNAVVDQLLNITSAIAYKNEDLVKNAYRALYSKIASEFFMSPAGFNMNNEKINRLFYGENSLVQMLSNIKRNTLWPELKNNALLKILSPTFDAENLNSIQLITVSNNGTNDRWAKQDIIYAWEELLTHRNEAVQKFARALVAYAFYTSGFNKKANSFFSFIPMKYLHDIGFNDFFVNKLNEYSSGVTDIDFSATIKDILLNNWNNDELVPEINTYTVDTANQYKDKTADYPRLISMRSREEGVSNISNFMIGINQDGQPVFKPVLKAVMADEKTTILYEYVGFVVDNDGEYRGVYRPIQKKGFTSPGYVIYEYGFEESALNENPKPVSVSDTSLEMLNQTNPDGTAKHKALSSFLGFERVTDLSTVAQTSSVEKETTTNDVQLWIDSLSDEQKETLQQKSGKTIEEIVADPSNTTEFLEHLLNC